MKPETISLLYKVNDKLKAIRDEMDDYMYRSGGIPDEDHDACRKIYNAICEVQDKM